jgi:hypothetical protein
MAGGMDWFRWHHGSVTDPKFQLVAKQAGASVAEVIAVWACLLEAASQDAGSLAGFDHSSCDRLLGIGCGMSTRIRSEMGRRGLLDGDRVENPRRYFPAPSMRPSGGAWEAIRSLIFRRDDYTCQYCGTRGGRLECDHVVPVADGGAHTDDNLMTACFGCNRSKGSKSLESWRG